jgi:adenine-specific DNA-methyltransferase
MPTLEWIGKKAVVNHHRQVPYRMLKGVPELSVGDPGSGNLLVQGDNLLALKALLPYYAGQVKCIYIDPPYNTGNENWVYNDNSNAPEIKKWLGKTVGHEAEDLSRHDKWLCMMYPRLQLLHQMLREDGLIFINLDDTETAHLRLTMDEIFGRRNFLAAIAWEKRYTRSNNAKMFYSLKDTITVYRKSDAVSMLKEARTEKANSLYKNPDNDPRGAWMTSSYVNPATKAMRPNLVYPLKNPKTGRIVEHPTHAWKYALSEHQRHAEERLLWWGESGTAKYPRLKNFLPKDSDAGLVPVDLWGYEESGTTDQGGAELKELFGSAVFDNPKPTRLIERILQLSTAKDSLILNSFAGSGTTGHAFMKLNAQDGGNRRFILIEMEEHIAQTITAERLKRAAALVCEDGGGAIWGSCREARKDRAPRLPLRHPRLGTLRRRRPDQPRCPLPRPHPPRLLRRNRRAPAQRY